MQHKPLTILLRHRSIESCLGELRRNQGLHQLLGIESEAQVPKKWNMSRFLDALGTEPQLSLLREVFDTMVHRLGDVVADLGVHTAGDASGLNARREKGKKSTQSVLPLPVGGHKEYTNESGKVIKVVVWFGYKFHLLVDVKHEVVLIAVIREAHPPTQLSHQPYIPGNNATGSPLWAMRNGQSGLV